MSSKTLSQRILPFLILFSFANMDLPAQSLLDVLPVIPKPAQMALQEGNFNLTGETQIILLNSELKNEAELFNDYLEENYGLRLKISSARQSKKACINLSLPDVGINSSREGYKLIVKPSGVAIKASTGSGVFYGLQTLLQLLPPGKTN